MARERPVRRLDQPRELRSAVVPRVHYDPEVFGRLSERVARFLGTWRFIGYMTLFIALWLGWNTLAPSNWQFDKYTFTFLTLLLSLQASYAAPLILLAQNRQADRDRVQYEQDRARSERTIADTEYLAREVAALRIAVGEVVTRDFLRSEMQRLLEDLEERTPSRPPGEEGAGDAEATDQGAA